jgi:acetyl-CoA carboxylase biotin carboxylase subunit
VFEGWTVPIDYDPLISKLVAWAPSRSEAIQRMQRALKEYQVDGIKTNLGFFREILNDPDFLAGDFDTGFIDRWLKHRPGPAQISQIDADLAAIAAALFDAVPRPEHDATAAPKSSWKTAARLRGMRR